MSKKRWSELDHEVGSISPSKYSRKGVITREGDYLGKSSEEYLFQNTLEIRVIRYGYKVKGHLGGSDC